MQQYFYCHSYLSDSRCFWLLMIGQFVLALNTTMVWNASSLLSCVWFPHKQRATATSITGAVAPTVRDKIPHNLACMYQHHSPRYS